MKGGGGVDPPPAKKKLLFFRQNVKYIHYSAYPEKLFFSIIVYFIVTPSLSSNELLKKKGENRFFFCPLSGLRGGGENLWKLAMELYKAQQNKIEFCFLQVGINTYVHNE